MTNMKENSKTCISTSDLTSYHPRPVDFAAFVPWVCLQWQCPQRVVVTRLAQEVYIKQERRPSSSKSKSSKSLKTIHSDLDSLSEAKKGASGVNTPVTADPTTSADNDQCVLVKAYHDTKGYLVEISIVGCPFTIHRKVIQAFSLCLPFHPFFTKLSIRRGRLTPVLLREISKMLPHSNLTDICLDDSVVLGGKYEELFTQTSQLKYLSLNRCDISNAICKDIAAKIDFGSPGSSLLVLELGSNIISDQGAKEFAESLRRNRSLLHLNLSGNRITDAGAVAILSHLMEFQLTWDEIVDARQRKLKYTERRMELFASCYEDVLKIRKAEIASHSSSSKKGFKTSPKAPKDDRKKSKRNSPSHFVDERSPGEIADSMTKEIVGEFIDPYDELSVVKQDQDCYSLGNMVLCSLNLAYNNLSYLTIQKIHAVLKYQESAFKSARANGLMRVVFDGNYVPEYCKEYLQIQMYLKGAVIKKAPCGGSYSHKKSSPISRRSSLGKA